MPIKVAEILYLNCAPFYWDKHSPDLERIKIVWTPATPKQLGEMARENKIDAGPVSLLDSFELENDFEPLSNLGIAVKKAARSVLLFSKKPISSLAGCAIGLTPHSVTSSELLKFLLEGKYGISPKYRNGFSVRDDAQLLIGDEALKKIDKSDFTKRFPIVIDLGEEWHKWQNLPFVFARWMVRKNVDEKLKSGVLKLLERNLDATRKSVIPAVRQFEKSARWIYPGAKKYLQDFRYYLGPAEQKAISAFKRLTKGFAATVCGC